MHDMHVFLFIVHVLPILECNQQEQQQQKL